MVAAMARRKLNMNQTIFALRIPGVGVLMHPKHPDVQMFTGERVTHLKSALASEISEIILDTDETWSAGGLKLDLVDPMKKWSINYVGPMIHQETGKTHQMVLKGTYTSDLPHFDFDADMDPWTTAKACALEPWSREYFDALKRYH